MRYKPVTRFLEPDYARRTRLLPATDVTRTPILGTVLYDDGAIWRPVREYRRSHVSFPEIHAYHVEQAILSAEFIVHRGTQVFVDSSIHTADRKGENALEIAERFTMVLDTLPLTDVADCYADEVALVLHNEGGGTWGHYVVQNFPKVLLFRQHFPAGKIVLPAPHTHRQHSNFARMFDVYGIPPDHLLPVERGTSYRFRELVLIDFLYDFPRQAPHPFVIDALACFADTSLYPRPSSDTTRGVFVTRAEGRGMRAIANQSDLDPVLAARGLAKRQLGLAALQEQILCWQSHDLIVGTLGSDLTNIVFGRAGSRILAVSPDWFGDMFFYNLAIAKGMQWNELRCGSIVEEVAERHRSSFRVDPELLDTMLATLAV